MFYCFLPLHMYSFPHSSQNLSSQQAIWKNRKQLCAVRIVDTKEEQSSAITAPVVSLYYAIGQNLNKTKNSKGSTKIQYFCIAPVHNIIA